MTALVDPTVKIIWDTKFRCWVVWEFGADGQEASDEGQAFTHLIDAVSFARNITKNDLTKGLPERRKIILYTRGDKKETVNHV